jgi:hypothetical protein
MRPGLGGLKSSDMRPRVFIDVEGVDDPAIVAIVEETIRQSFSQRALAGSWRVQVCPSHVYGRWILSVHGLDARHSVSIVVPASLHPELDPLRLRESLDRLCSARLVEPIDDDGSYPRIRPKETLSA